MARSSTLTHLLVLFLLSLSFTAAIAGEDESEKGFLKFVSSDLSSAKTADELADKMAFLSPGKRDALKAWAKKHGVSQMPSVTVHGSDVLFQIEGQKAKLTLTDFKRNRMHLNDRFFVPGDSDKVDQYLNKALAHIRNQKTSFLQFFIPKAFADERSAEATLAFASGATAMSGSCWGNKACKLIEAIRAIPNVIFKSLQCNKPVDESLVATQLVLQLPLADDDDYDEINTFNEVRLETRILRNTLGSQAVQPTTMTTQEFESRPARNQYSDRPVVVASVPAREQEIMRLAVSCCIDADCNKDVEKALGEWKGRQPSKYTIQPMGRQNR